MKENGDSSEDQRRSRSRSEEKTKTVRSQRDRSRSRSNDREERSRSKRHDRSRSRNRDHRRDRRSRSRSSEREGDKLKKCWKSVKENSGDFDAWTRLLQCVEQMDDTKAAREAYDEFLRRYPYCYGYWRKYAELERRHKHYERSMEVYEHGVASIELSVDLWLHYLAFVREISQNQEGAIDKTRQIYDRALEACGLEFRSDKLWEECINWELSNAETVRVGALYDRLLCTPTLLYNSHMEKYEAFINSFEPDRVIAPEEYEEILAKAEAKLKDRVEGELYLQEEFVDESPPEFIKDNGEEPERKVIRRRKHCEEALSAMRAEIVDRRRKQHLINEQEVSRRWAFEESIKRPYFHVKPLERAQLRNWRAYLKFEVERGDLHRIVVLFERSLIACAMYSEMWTMYARYLSSINEVSRAKEVFRRATDIHLPRKLDVHLASSAFEEEHGNFEGAMKILVNFDRRNPGFAVLSLRRIGIERRMAMKTAEEGTAPDFSAVIPRFERLIHDSMTPRRLATFYALKLARFHAKTRNDRKLAEKIITDALNRDKDSTQLYLALVDLAYSACPFDENAVVRAFDTALDTEHLTDEDKLIFSQRKLDFLEDLGTDVDKLQKHLEYHTQLQKMIESTATTRTTSDNGNKGDQSDKRAQQPVQYTTATKIVQQTTQQQYYVSATPDAYAAATLAQQQAAAGLNPAYYYAAQPGAVVPVHQTY